MSDRIAQAGLALLAALLIGAGLIAVGGPEEARRFKRDEQRFVRLTAMAACLASLPDHEFNALSPDLQGRSTCSPAKGSPSAEDSYRLVRGEGRAFSLCTTFESASQLISSGSRDFDAETGCLAAARDG
jgi:hypothetical protein